MLKIKILLRSYLQMLFQDFLYLAMLFAIIVFGMTADHLLGISPVKKYSFLLIGMFFLSLFTTMNLYRNDQQNNRYLKQKINSYWYDVLSQFLVSLIENIFSGILVFIFSLILNRNLVLDAVGITTLVAVGLLGSAIATLFKSQWSRNNGVGQVGVLVFIYLSLVGSVISFLEKIEIILPPLSKILVTLQTKPVIQDLLPVAGQTFLYALILFLISALVYRKGYKFG